MDGAPASNGVEAVLAIRRPVVRARARRSSSGTCRSASIASCPPSPSFSIAPGAQPWLAAPDRDRRHRGRRRRGPTVLPDQRRQPPGRPAHRRSAGAGRVADRSRRDHALASLPGRQRRARAMSSSARRSRRRSTAGPASGIVVVGPWADALSDFVGMPDPCHPLRSARWHPPRQPDQHHLGRVAARAGGDTPAWRSSTAGASGC